MKKIRYLYWIIAVGFILYYIGVAFKIMHWANANEMIIIGLLSSALFGILLVINGVSQSIEFKSIQIFNIILGTLVFIPVFIYFVPQILYHKTLFPVTSWFCFLTIAVIILVFFNKNIWEKYIKEEKVLIGYMFVKNLLSIMLILDLHI